MRGGNFSRKVSQIYRHYLKYDQKLKKLFFQMEEGSNIKTKNGKIILYMRGFPPIQYIAL